MDALWPSERELALLTDLYELTMAQAYWRDDHRGEAVFSPVSYTHLTLPTNYSV